MNPTKYNPRYSAFELADTSSMSKAIRIGQNLKAAIKARRLTLKSLSRLVGIPYSTLHTWCDNRQPRDIVKVKRLCDYLGVDLDAFLFGDGAPAHHEDLPSGEGIEGSYELIIRKLRNHDVR